MKEFCQLGNNELDLLRKAVNQLQLSARAYHRIIKIARTISDLAGAEQIEIPAPRRGDSVQAEADVRKLFLFFKIVYIIQLAGAVFL